MFYLVVSLCNYGLYTVFVQKGKKNSNKQTYQLVSAKLLVVYNVWLWYGSV